MIGRAEEPDAVAEIELVRYGLTKVVAILSFGVLNFVVLHRRMFASFGMGLDWFGLLGNHIYWSWSLMKVCAYSVKNYSFGE